MAKGKGLTFPPLVKQWTVKGEASWPGAEYTRRTRLKTRFEQEFSAEFLDELKETLGEKGFESFTKEMQPSVNRKLTRGKPAAESGHRAIQPAYTLRRADGPIDPDEDNPLAGTTLSLSGHVSKTKVPGNMFTKHGPVRGARLNGGDARASTRPSAPSPPSLAFGRCPSTCLTIARRWTRSHRGSTSMAGRRRTPSTWALASSTRTSRRAASDAVERTAT